jgi:hypothetical protein
MTRCTPDKSTGTDWLIRESEADCAVAEMTATAPTRFTAMFTNSELAAVKT